jgi:beta-glucosidase
LVGMLKAHVKAYRYLHEQAASRGQKIQVGMAHHLRPGVGSNWLVHQGVRMANYFLTWNIPLAVSSGVVRGFPRYDLFGIKIPYFKKLKIEGLKDSQDFLGINYYTREKITLGFKAPYFKMGPLDGMTGSDLNWGIDPKGLYEVLELSHKYFPNLPFFITENGIADAKDQWRQKYTVDHLKEIHRAMTGLPHRIDGYCHWSMMDNFEWHEGFTPRFGIFHTNYEKQGERTLKKSGERIREIYRTGRIED